MKKIQKGFSLVELMIVVAIIGILASIAVPQYNNYIARAQVSEAISLLGAVRSQISEAVATSGSSIIPADFEQSVVATENAGTFVECIIVSAALVTDCTTGGLTAIDTTAAVLFVGAVLQSSADGVNGVVAARSIQLKRNSGINGAWECGSDGATTTGIEVKYLPGSCKATIAL